MGMKLSISMPDDDVAFVDQYAKDQGYPSRSAVLVTAVRILRSQKLGDSYAEAWQQWEESGDDDLWDRAAADGIA